MLFTERRVSVSRCGRTLRGALNPLETAGRPGRLGKVELGFGGGVAEPVRVQMLLGQRRQVAL
jgi:hypothetical protein